MFQQVKNRTVPITIGVAFYVFGFFSMANALKLTEREIVVGLIAGAVAGITILVAILWQEQTTSPSPSRATASAA